MRHERRKRHTVNNTENRNPTAAANEVKDILLGGGAGEVGFCRLETENDFKLGYAVSFYIPLSDAIVDGIDGAPTHTYFHHYRTVNTLIDNLALRAGLTFARHGYRYAPIPASQSVCGLQGIFSHKYAAVLSGLGTVGKSGLFLSSKFGPRVRLGTILTDCKVAEGSKLLPSVCGGCNLCAAACPAMAITGEEWKAGEEREKIVDAKACSEYMKKKFQLIGRGSVCGICMRVCPRGGRH